MRAPRRGCGGDGCRRYTIASETAINSTDIGTECHGMRTSEKIILFKHKCTYLENEKVSGSIRLDGKVLKEETEEMYIRVILSASG